MKQYRLVLLIYLGVAAPTNSFVVTYSGIFLGSQNHLLRFRAHVIIISFLGMSYPKPYMWLYAFTLTAIFAILDINKH